MKSTPTLLRTAEHSALATISLSGSVLDLGGDTHADYRTYIKGDYSVTTLNMDPHTSPDIVHDLETLLPTEDASYDHALLINVLEHIFEYRQLLTEAVRSVRVGGTVVVVVPFLFPIHKDPHDFWRFSEEALTKEFERLAVTDVRVVPLGTGVIAACYVMLDRLMPGILRTLMHYTLRFLVAPLDALTASLAHALGKKYLKSDYALGYLVTGIKPTYG